MSEPSFIEGVDVETLLAFEEEGYSDEDALALAQGLLVSAVPCLQTIYTDLPSETKTATKYAVLEMAKFIKTDYFNFERATSPFQSETIGSYTYNKMSSAIRKGEQTGVPGFDRAVDLLGPLCELETSGGAITHSTSEKVFKPGYDDFIAERGTVGYSTDLTTWWWSF